jgi:DNA-binding NtrC family response regulator
MVDDEPSILSLYGVILTRAGVPSIRTTNVTTALNELRHSEIALIISDQEMPAMKGLQLLEEAKEISPETIRIMLTGHPSESLAIDAINLAAVHRFLVKPVKSKEFLEIVQKGLEQYGFTSNKSSASELKEIRIELAQLVSGMVLSRELKTESGVLLLPKNAELSVNRISLIKNHQERDPIFGEIFIHEPSKKV